MKEQSDADQLLGCWVTVFQTLGTFIFILTSPLWILPYAVLKYAREIKK